jgi:tetratricopeptide (TPR) repeat protein
MSQPPEALATYRAAIESFDAALRRDPDYISAYDNRGSALESAGAMLAFLSRNEEALASYNAAVQSFNEVLKRTPDNTLAHKNKATVLKSIGDL